MQGITTRRPKRIRSVSAIVGGRQYGVGGVADELDNCSMHRARCCAS